MTDRQMAVLFVALLIIMLGGTGGIFIYFGARNNDCRDAIPNKYGYCPDKRQRFLIEQQLVVCRCIRDEETNN